MTTENFLREATVNTSLDDALSLAASLQENLNAVVLGTPDAVVTATTARARRRTPAHRRRARGRQDDARQGGRRLDRHPPRPDPGSSRPAPVRHHRRLESSQPRLTPGSSGPGPVFAHVVLFDELNRTPPRSQAALLEAMEERQVTVDGESWPLPEPHLVLATQNPIDQAGTFPLVESQMDRFLLATRLGYPDEATETRLALSHGAQPSLASLSPVCTPGRPRRRPGGRRRPAGSARGRPLRRRHRAGEPRPTRCVRLGASPRATIGLLAAARAHAVIRGRDFVLPDDVKAVAAQRPRPPPCHRCRARSAPSTPGIAAVRGDPRAGSLAEAVMRGARAAAPSRRERAAVAQRPARRSATWPCPSVPSGRSPARLLLLFVWAGVAHASGSGWVQAVGARGRRSCSSLGLVGPGLRRARAHRHLRALPRRRRRRARRRASTSSPTGRCAARRVGPAGRPSCLDRQVPAPHWSSCRTAA